MLSTGVYADTTMGIRIVQYVFNSHLHAAKKYCNKP